MEQHNLKETAIGFLLILLLTLLALPLWLNPSLPEEPQPKVALAPDALHQPPVNNTSSDLSLTSLAPPEEKSSTVVPPVSSLTLTSLKDSEGAAMAQPIATEKNPQINQPVALLNPEKSAKPAKNAQIAASAPSAVVPLAPAQVAPPTAQKNERWLQSGSFSKKENAVKQMESLKQKGFNVIISTDKKSKLHRVLVGPVYTEEEKTKQIERLRQSGIQSVFTTQR